MNETAAISFPDALRASMESGCGRDIDGHGYAEPWGQQALAGEIGVSDRLIRQWLDGNRSPGIENFDQLLAVMAPKDCPRQQAVYDRLKASRPQPSIARRARPKPASAKPRHFPPIPADARPYRGLEAFREADAHLFFGRDALAESILGKLDHHRLVLLAGASGSGKSSLINAAIIPSIRKRGGHHVVRCTPGDRAIANLAAALARELGQGRSPAELLADRKSYQESLLADPDAIRDIAQLLPDGRLFLVLDQFEETFTLTRPASAQQHEALIALLLAIARSPDDQKLTALLGMRSDFLAELETASPEFNQSLDNAMVRMRPMFPTELATAITAPAEHFGVTMEPDLLIAITDELAGNRDALPLLEVALDELWNRRDATRGCLTLAALAEIGGITGALARRADDALHNFGLDEALVRRLLLELVRVDPDEAADRATRHPRTKDELDAVDRALWPIGEQLASRNLRLLVTTEDAATGGPVIDLAHEALLRKWPTLTKWIDQEREFLLFRDRLDRRIADFDANAGDPGYYLPQAELALAQEWLTRRVEALAGKRTAFITASARHWTEDAADDAARALWGRLELSFTAAYERIPPHDHSALTDLQLADRETRQRFLLIATNDSNAARKFNRKPELILRAATGLDPLTALDLAMAAIDAKCGSSLENELTWLSVANHLSLLAPTRPPDILDRALGAVFETTTPRALQTLAQTINALADKLDTHSLKDAANRTVDCALNAIERTYDEDRLEALVQTINALAEKLDTEAANRTVERAINAIERGTGTYQLQALAQTINAFVDKLDTEGTNRTVDCALNAIRPNTKYSELETLVQTINALAEKLDTETTNRAVDCALSAIERATNWYQRWALAQTINALANKLDTNRLKDAANQTVDCALNAIERNTDPYHRLILVQTINALANKLDTKVANRTVDCILDVIERNTDLNRALAETIDSVAQTINALADKLDTRSLKDAANRTVDCVLNAIERTYNVDKLQHLAQTINALADKLDTNRLKDAVNRTVDRALSVIERRSVIERTTSLAELQALAQTINALADKLDTNRLKDAANSTVDRALNAIEQTTSPRALQALAQTINAMAQHLPLPALVLAATETLKQPLGGHQRVTELLLVAITRDFGCPELLSKFPERSFWAVMQHLAEVKAANPDWDWLDLARPPMPTDELIATFRDLCTNPPDWPATTAPA